MIVPSLKTTSLTLMIAGAMFAASACSDGGETGSVPEACIDGDLGCACFPNETCNDELVCFNSVCIPDEEDPEPDPEPEVEPDPEPTVDPNPDPQPEQVEDPCEPDPCQNGGACAETDDGFACECLDGFEGETCETDIDDCADAPCLNGGDCTDGINAFVCECAEGFEGDTCETDIDDCADDPCANGGTCTDGIAGFACECLDGFEGDTCETDIDDCADAPCLNGGDCTDGINAFVCDCAEGFEGETCETNIDDCANEPCFNGGACTDGIAEFTCECLDGFEGDTCETDIDDCADAPCLNGGDCTDGINAFVCDCAEGFEGDTCETDIDDCAGDPCLNDGTCIDGIAEFVCECPLGFDGETCETCVGSPELPDADADGISDICDTVCPNDPLNDVDGDGICGSIDLCPDVADDGRDGDGDGVPDACDCRPDDNTRPSAEVCDGIDNDCDDETDEFEDLGGAFCVLVNTTEDPFVNDARIQDCFFGDGTCSLRAALTVSTASEVDTIINVPGGTYTLTQAERMTVDGYSVAIKGAGLEETIIEGDGVSRGIELVGGESCSVEGLTIQNTLSAGIVCSATEFAAVRDVRSSGNSTSENRGAGLTVTAEDVAIEGCTVDNNSNTIDFREDNSAAGILMLGRGHIVETLVEDNIASVVQGQDTLGARTGGIRAGGHIEILDTIVRGNTGMTVGGLDINGNVEMRRLTVSENTIRGSGSSGLEMSNAFRVVVEDTLFDSNSSELGSLITHAFRGFQADFDFNRVVMINNDALEDRSSLAIFRYHNRGVGSRLRIRNSTIAGNSSPNIFNFTFLSSGDSEVLLDHVTMVDNTSPGLAVSISSVIESNRVIARNSIFANPGVRSEFPNPGTQAISEGHNIVRALTGGMVTADTDLIGTVQSPIDPRLLPLSDNGGQTLPFIGVDVDSPARDAIPASDLTQHIDQAGNSRPIDTDGQDPRADIGATEMVCLGDDSDGDGTPDACDRDLDNDSIADIIDNCPTIPNTDQQNDDGDPNGNACDEDDDNDNVLDGDDNCPITVNTNQADGDSDGIGDVCDNCPGDANADQSDLDGDGIGEVCDNCVALANADQTDINNDGVGDTCDADLDSVDDGLDNCPDLANADQADLDEDGIGDVCDECPNDADNDIDFDDVCGDVDNCPDTANADQSDGDFDGIGDACDACPNDADNDIDGDNVCGDVDNCPDTANADQANTILDNDILPTATSIAFAPRTLDGNATNVDFGGQNETVFVDIGFEFVHFGEVFTHVGISDNGFLTFQGPGRLNFIPRALPHVPERLDVSSIIAGYWGDFIVEQGETVRYQVFGQAPNRELVVEYLDMVMVGNVGVPNTANSFQIVLREDGHTSEVHCTQCTRGVADSEHTQGIQNTQGTRAITLPGRNLAVFEAQNDGVRFTSDVFIIGDACTEP